MKVWFVTIVQLIMDVLKQPSLFCVVVWKPSLHDFNSIQTSFENLKKAIDDFVTGKEIAATSSDLTLKDGIALLKKALEQFQAGDQASGAASMKEFITIWPTIEGSVSTTNPSLYTRVESESPVIMVKGSGKGIPRKN